MDEQTLNTLLENYCHITSIHYYETTDSTNNRAKQLVRTTAENEAGGIIQCPQLFISEVQTAGRGRLGRTWESPAGEGIWMSYLCKPKLSPDQIPAITLLAGLAVTKAINSFALNRSLFNLHAEIKWPNDVIINRRKVCGILTELIDSTQYVVCGIGVNVNNRSFPEELSDKATSLLKESGVNWDRERLISVIIKNLSEYIKGYEKTGDLQFILDDYNSLLVSINKEVVLVAGSGNLKQTSGGNTFVSRGIDTSGALIVEDSEGNIQTVTSGEVSVRGINGYI